MSLEDNQDQLEDSLEITNEEEINNQAEEQHSEEKRGFKAYQEFVDGGGDPDEFQGEKAYDAYGRLLKEVNNLKKEVRKKNTTLETMADLYRNQEQQIAEKYKNYYQQQQYRLSEAEQMGDVPEATNATREMIRTENMYQQEIQKNKASYQAQLVEEFKARNSDWYNQENPELVTKAQHLAIQYEREFPHLVAQDPNYLLQKVEDEIRNRYAGASAYSGKRATAGSGMNHTLPPSQSGANKGIANKSKVGQLTPAMREEYNQVKQFYSATGIDYTVDDFLSFHERNKV